MVVVRLSITDPTSLIRQGSEKGRRKSARRQQSQKYVLDRQAFRCSLREGHSSVQDRGSDRFLEEGRGEEEKAAVAAAGIPPISVHDQRAEIRSPLIRAD